jgi:hypothetical protein
MWSTIILNAKGLLLNILLGMGIFFLHKIFSQEVDATSYKLSNHRKINHLLQLVPFYLLII